MPTHTPSERRKNATTPGAGRTAAPKRRRKAPSRKPGAVGQPKGAGTSARTQKNLKDAARADSRARDATKQMARITQRRQTQSGASRVNPVLWAGAMKTAAPGKQGIKPLTHPKRKAAIDTLRAIPGKGKPKSLPFPSRGRTRTSKKKNLKRNPR